MDPLSIAASIIAILQASLKVISFVQAPDREILQTKVASLTRLLGLLQKDIADQGVANDGSNGWLKQSEALKAELSQLELRLKKLQPHADRPAELSRRWKAEMKRRVSTAQISATLEDINKIEQHIGLILTLINRSVQRPAHFFNYG